MAAKTAGARRASKKYSGMTFSERGGVDEITIDSLDIARQVFIKNTPLRHRPIVAMLRSAFQHTLMIAADGDYWRATRDAIMPALLPSTVARAYTASMIEIANDEFSDIARRSKNVRNDPAGLQLDVERCMRQVTSRAMGYVLFGKALTREEAEFVDETLDAMTTASDGRITSAFNNVMSDLYTRIGWRQYQPVRFSRPTADSVRKFLSWLSRKVKDSDPTLSLLNSLMDRHDCRSSNEQYRRVAAECAMLFIAGIETTSASLTFAIAEMANSETIFKTVVEEATSVTYDPDSGVPVTSQFPIIAALMQESLRRHTVVPTMLREAAEDHTVEVKCPGDHSARENVKIKKGTVLRYLPVLNHMRRKVWKDPHVFRPGRHQDATAEQRRHLNPFGIGPQSCPGRGLATAESILIIQSLCTHLTIGPKPIHEPIPTTLNRVFTVRPIGVTVTVHARSANSNSL